MSISELISRLEGIYSKWSTKKEEIVKALDYLKRYGYIPEDVRSMTIEDIFEALAKFQELAGLQSDGELGPKTLRAMNDPRCACPDFYEDDDGLLRMETLESKWGTRNLTYYIESRDRDLSAAVWDETIEKAYQQWSDVANLKFTRVNSPSQANFILGVGSGRGNNFDGSGGTLAWHQLPPGNSYNGRLRGMFDAAETWVDDPRQRGILLLNVACHEIGHGLGLGHSRVNSALMAPFYSANVPKPQQRDDITRIQSLYGRPTGGGGGDVDPPVDPEEIPAPTRLTAEPVEGSDDRVSLVWEDNSTGEDGFQIYRGDEYQGMVGRGNTRAIDAQVPEGRHEYRVRAVKGGKVSPWSNTAVVTLGEPDDPDPEDKLVIQVEGKVTDIKIPGYRVQKIG